MVHIHDDLEPIVRMRSQVELVTQPPFT